MLFFYSPFEKYFKPSKNAMIFFFSPNYETFDSLDRFDKSYKNIIRKIHRFFGLIQRQLHTHCIFSPSDDIYSFW